MKRRTLLATAVAVTMIGGIAGQAFAQEKVLNVYNWSDYIDESILADFTKETGIKVVYDVFDSNETLETKLLAGGSGYDIVVPTANFLQRQIQAGVFQKLDKSKLPNLSNMWPEISERVAVYDPGNEHAITYMWGTTGLGYNVAKTKEILGSDAAPTWDAIFNPETAAKFKDCGVYVLDTADEVVPAALNYLGLDPNSKDQADLDKAGELLMTIRPNIRKFHSSEYINALANGDICLALGWSGDVLQARDRASEANAGVEVNYSIPDGGALMWFDMMAIPADAKNVEAAHTFLNYILTPEVIAPISDYVAYPNGNAAATPLVAEEIRNNPGIYPTEAASKKLYTFSELSPSVQRAVTRSWTKVKSGR